MINNNNDDGQEYAIQKKGVALLQKDEGFVDLSENLGFISTVYYSFMFVRLSVKGEFLAIEKIATT